MHSNELFIVILLLNFLLLQQWDAISMQNMSELACCSVYTFFMDGARRMCSLLSSHKLYVKLIKK